MRIFSILFIVIISLSTGLSQSQPKKARSFKHQLTFILDNDVLAFGGTDRYYTNGLFFQYSNLRTPKNNSVVKQINEWEIGQQVYNAYRREVYTVADLDRPIAGYLYGKFSTAKFKTHNQLWKYGVSIGTIGKASQAEQLTHFFHPLIGINSNWWGWIYDYQLKGEIGLNAHGKYAFSVIKNNHGAFQLTPETNLTLGTSFINASQSLLFQFGKFNQMHESGFWNSGIGNQTTSDNRRKELFLFYQPEVVFQAYNATIQGGMFRKDKGEVTSTPEPFVVYNSAGLMYSSKRFTSSFQYVFQTREAKSQRDNHMYGRLKMAYRF